MLYGHHHLMLIIFPIKKIEKQRSFIAPQALSGDTELTARAANVLNSAAKVRPCKPEKHAYTNLLFPDLHRLTLFLIDEIGSSDIVESH